MLGPEALGQQLLDALADDFVVRVAEERGNLPVGKTDDAGRVDDEHRVRSGVEGAARKSRRNLKHR